MWLNLAQQGLTVTSFSASSANGGNDNDTIDGGIGDDKLEGGNGNDTLTGGPGAHRFKGNGGVDTATDYDPGEHDKKDSDVENF
jgi:Ca2+-binding RTX toxin-like protein